MRSLISRLGLKPNPLKLYLTSVVVLASIASSNTLSAMCGKCLNNSTCRIITYLESNASVVQCACLQGWLGADCQEFVNLRLVTVTMTTVTLEFEITSAHNHKSRRSQNAFPELVKLKNQSHVIIANKQIENGAAFIQKPLSVEYWISRTGVCNIVPNLTKPNFTIMGLQPATGYTFCTRTNQSPTCYYNLVRGHNRDTNVPHCKHVITKSDDKSVPYVYVILASCIALCGLIALVVVIVIAKRRGYLTTMFCVKKSTSAIHKRTKKETLHMAPSRENSDFDVLLMKPPRTDQTISISNPQGPGRPKYQVIHKRLRGYASFSARNEQTIPLSTVLEYGTEDQDYDEDDAIDDVEYPEGQTEVEIHVHTEANDQVDIPRDLSYS